MPRLPSRTQDSAYVGKTRHAASLPVFRAITPISGIVGRNQSRSRTERVGSTNQQLAAFNSTSPEVFSKPDMPTRIARSVVAHERSVLVLCPIPAGGRKRVPD